MAWIRTVARADAGETLAELYRRISGPDGEVDNIMRVHGLRPHTLEGHMALYKRVLHHSANRVPRWFLEVIGMFTSQLNRCEYCVRHHRAGLARLMGDDARCDAMCAALASGDWRQAFDAAQAAALAYVRKLTECPSELVEADIVALRDAGWSDGEILEINQVGAYFAYANRTVLGLGVDTDGDTLGLSPSATSDSEDWRHA